MSFNRADYKEIFDFAESVYSATPALKQRAERVMAMVETVIGQQRAYGARMNPGTASEAYFNACRRGEKQ